MKGVEKIRDGLYVKKSFDGCRVVYPIKNDDGTWNFFNLLTGGNWWKVVKLILILLMLFGLTWSYMRDTRICRELTDKIKDNPQEFCINLTEGINKPYWDIDLESMDEFIVDEVKDEKNS